MKVYKEFVLTLSTSKRNKESKYSIEFDTWAILISTCEGPIIL